MSSLPSREEQPWTTRAFWVVAVPSCVACDYGL